jgi:hypothetical protein
MRELIIARLQEIKEKERGFSRVGTMRWANMYISIPTIKHISDVNWNELPDKELLSVFERVIRQYYKSTK